MAGLVTVVAPFISLPLKIRKRMNYFDTGLLELLASNLLDFLLHSRKN